MDTRERTTVSDAGQEKAKLEELDTVIAIPPIPFRQGSVDETAHCKNLDYLLERNFLDRGRRRAIGIAGTSLVHHIETERLLSLLDVTGRVAGERAIVIAGVVATPPSPARKFIQTAMKLRRPPDYFLLMPIPGVCNPQGLRDELARLARECGDEYGAQFLLYLRSSGLAEAYARLVLDVPYIGGIKVGTREEDVSDLLSALEGSGKVLWGVGDRAAGAARRGARGHTSGITLICPRACDEINNAYRRGDFAGTFRLEEIISELEQIRFMEERAYNYSAVVAAARLGAFEDVDLGEGGPFNAPPPPEVLSRLELCVQKLKEYH